MDAFCTPNEKSVLVNPALRFTETAGSLLKLSVLRAGARKQAPAVAFLERMGGGKCMK